MGEVVQISLVVLLRSFLVKEMMIIGWCKKNCGLYMRVSTENQVREGFSLPEQKERLEAYCKFKGFVIKDYYTDAGISSKTGNYRPEFERIKEDIKSKKINTIIALKQDRITRSIFDWEELMRFLE